MSKAQTHMDGWENAAGFNDSSAPLKDAQHLSLALHQTASLKKCNQNLSMAGDGLVSAAARAACLQAGVGILVENSVLPCCQPSHLNHKEKKC